MSVRAEPFRNLITFELDDVSGGKSGNKHGGKRVGRGYAKKEKREEEESLDAQFHGRTLPSYTKCKIKGLSAQRLKHSLHLDPL